MWEVKRGMRNRTSLRINRSRFTLIFLIVCVTSCDEPTIVLPEPEAPFSLYGYLSPRADTQAIRVFPLATRLEKVPPAPIDAEVVSVDLSTGERRLWNDSLVQIAPGDFRHVFWNVFVPEYAHAYRIEVRRSDGALSSADFSTPPDVKIEVIELEALPGTNVLRQTVQWNGAPLIHDVQVHYHRSIISGNAVVGHDTVTVSKLDRRERIPGGWEVVIDYWADRPRITAPSTKHDGIPVLESIEMKALVAHSAWFPPSGTFDRQRLIWAGTFSNVQNGYGFVGGGYEASVRWPPDSELSSRLN